MSKSRPGKALDGKGKPRNNIAVGQQLSNLANDDDLAYSLQWVAFSNRYMALEGVSGKMNVNL